MRRWNGWGEEGVDDAAAGARPGPARPARRARDAADGRPPRGRGRRRAAVATGDDDAWTTDARDRVLHARGQSLPDWVALRSGRLEAIPDAVARPTTADEVRAVLAPGGRARRPGRPVRRRDERRRWRHDHARRRPDRQRGPRRDRRPALARRGQRPRDVRCRDDRSGHRGGARTRRPDARPLPAVVRALDGRRLGRDALGRPGVVRRRSDRGAVRRRSPRDARSGRWTCRPIRPPPPGPDLRQLVLGSEGRLGILTDVTVRTSRVAQATRVNAFVMRDWDAALTLARTLAQRRLPLSMVRVATPLETATTFALVGDGRSQSMLRRYLGWRGLGRRPGALPRPRRAVGTRRPVVDAAAGEVAKAVRELHGVGHARRRACLAAGSLQGPEPARHALVGGLRRRHARDGRRLERRCRTSPPSSAARSATGSTPIDERVHAFSHLSHVYPSGTSLYSTYVFRIAADPDETLDRWRRLKAAASEVDRPPRRHDQPPARRGLGPRAVPGGREGTARDGRHRGGRPDVRPGWADEPGRPARRGARVTGRSTGSADQVIAIDVGTQSVRALVFDPAGTLIAMAKVPDRAVRVAPAGLGRAGSRAVLAIDRARRAGRSWRIPRSGSMPSPG